MADSKSISIEIVKLIPVTVMGDNNLLKIALVNLIKNAILYSPLDKKIEIKIEEDESRYIVTIRDQGIGIPKESLKSIFDRFYRVNQNRVGVGSGLGLPIAKRILDIHRFNISIESRFTEGTEVKVFIF
jgi:signal transduction histidine kinase